MGNILGRASLSNEELIKILCDCEQVVNARLLICVTENVNDLAPLLSPIFLQDVIVFDAIDAQELNKRIKATYSRTPTKTIPY